MIAPTEPSPSVSFASDRGFSGRSGGGAVMAIGGGICLGFLQFDGDDFGDFLLVDGAAATGVVLAEAKTLD